MFWSKGTCCTSCILEMIGQGSILVEFPRWSAFRDSKSNVTCVMYGLIVMTPIGLLLIHMKLHTPKNSSPKIGITVYTLRRIYFMSLLWMWQCAGCKNLKWQCQKSSDANEEEKIMAISCRSEWFSRSFYFSSPSSSSSSLSVIRGAIAVPGVTLPGPLFSPSNFTRKYSGL